MRLIKKGTLFGWDSFIWYLIGAFGFMVFVAIVGFHGL